MIKRCRFCAGKVQSDATDCEHCGKVLVKKADDGKGKQSLNDLEAWKGKSVPAWVMYAVAAFLLFVIGVIIAIGFGWIEYN